jgi:hypothetical protein
MGRSAGWKVGRLCDVGRMAGREDGSRYWIENRTFRPRRKEEAEGS